MKASSLPMFTLWSFSWDWPVLSNWIKNSAQGNYRWSWHGLSSGHTSSPKITCQIKKIIKKKNYCSYCHWLFWLSFCSAENIFRYYIFKNKQVKIEKKHFFYTAIRYLFTYINKNTSFALDCQASQNIHQFEKKIVDQQRGDVQNCDQILLFCVKLFWKQCKSKVLV